MHRALLLPLITLVATCGTTQVSVAVHEPVTMVYANADGHDLHAYVFQPAPTGSRATRSAILLVHGGGWVAGEAAWTFDAARSFAEAGMVAIPIEYRLSEGTVTPIDALADVCAAFRWTRAHAAELRIDSKRVVGYGVSAGGHLVAAAATVGCPPAAGQPRAEPDALVLLSPALDLGHDVWFGQLLKGATPADYSPADHVKATTPPTTIVHGEKDRLVPVAGVQRFCERLRERAVACELTVFPGLGHVLAHNLDPDGPYDPDPAARKTGAAKQLAFLKTFGFVEKR